MHRFLSVFSSIGCILFALLGVANVQAAVNAEATRVVFNDGETEASLQLVNKNTYPVVVQAWSDDGDPQATPDKSASPVLVLPAVFKLQPEEMTNLRLIVMDNPLPKDRESMFWLNIYEIPPRLAGDSVQKITIALRTQMKLFLRPKGLGKPEKSIGQKITFMRQNESLTIENPTEFYLSLIGVTINNIPLDIGTLPPKSHHQITLPSGLENTSKKISFSLINDEGNYWDYNQIIN
ncbi:pilus assembly protein [Hafnia alvei FB1]|uniref:Pilus assembly protein n=1 Tax=Hafnia alvei FB1 TaxID=1453496 RepID=A0A097R7D3_HAFAL|nr:molecular chaperone [Hafnia alvei]AIU74640.1 pilus assembly protein [Hafnia alvei FB1]TBL63963.1 molecular chaperone [Hafnia alvei]